MNFKRKLERRRSKKVGTVSNITTRIRIKNPIIDPEETVNVAQKILSFSYGHMNAKDDRDFLKLVRSFRAQINIEKITTDDWFIFFEFYFELCKKKQIESNIVSIIFGTQSGEVNKSKKIIDLFTDLFYLSTQMDDKNESKQLSIVQIFNDFLMYAPGTCTWENITGNLENPEIRKSFKNFIFCCISLTATPVCIPYSEWISKIEPAFKFNKQSKKDCFVFIPVKDESILAVKKVIDEIYSNADVGVKEKLFVLENFNRNIDYYHNKAIKLMEDIKNNPKCWLRENGKDSVKINLNGYNKGELKLSKLQFVSEGYDFPECQARFWVKVSGKILVLKYNVPENISIKNFKVSNLASDDPRSIEDKMLLYISVHCLHRIVVGAENETVLQFSKNYTPTTKKIKVKIKKEKTEVRPYFRRLPDGQEASEEAQLCAIDALNMLPPEGMTFVKAHQRVLADEYEKIKNSDSLFTYKNEDLGILT